MKEGSRPRFAGWFLGRGPVGCLRGGVLIVGHGAVGTVAVWGSWRDCARCSMSWRREGTGSCAVTKDEAGLCRALLHHAPQLRHRRPTR